MILLRWRVRRALVFGITGCEIRRTWCIFLYKALQIAAVKRDKSPARITSVYGGVFGKACMFTIQITPSRAHV
ncbi:hypothetical protein ACFL6I_14225 [candidate division KSB1 bacterium]